MSVLEQLQNALPDLSKSERKVAEYLLRYPYDVRRFPCDGLAAACNTSRSAVIRLCKKLGFHGYAEFRYSLTTHPEKAGREDSRKTALSYYEEGIRQLHSTVEPEQLKKIAEIILGADRVLTLGIGHSFLSAQQMAFRLNRVHIDSHAVTDTTIMNNYTSILKGGDVVLIFSLSGNKSYLDYVKLYRENQATVVLFTMTGGAKLAKELEHVVVLPYISHSSYDYLLDDAITFFLLIEMLMEAVYEKQRSAVCSREGTPGGEV